MQYLYEYYDPSRAYAELAPKKNDNIKTIVFRTDTDHNVDFYWNLTRQCIAHRNAKKEDVNKIYHGNWNGEIERFQDKTLITTDGKNILDALNQLNEASGDGKIRLCFQQHGGPDGRNEFKIDKDSASNIIDIVSSKGYKELRISDGSCHGGIKKAFNEAIKPVHLKIIVRSAKDINQIRPQLGHTVSRVSDGFLKRDKYTYHNGEFTLNEGKIYDHPAPIVIPYTQTNNECTSVEDMQLQKQQYQR